MKIFFESIKGINLSNFVYFSASIILAFSIFLPNANVILSEIEPSIIIVSWGT